MVAARANWKGFIKFGELAFSVALYTAASSSERIAFNTLNRATGNRVRREFVDSETGDPVERNDQVKGYEVESGAYVVLEPEEVAAAISSNFQTLFPGDQSLDFFSTSFLQQSPTTAARLIAAARATIIMKHPVNEAEELVFQMLNDEARPTISVSVHD